MESVYERVKHNKYRKGLICSILLFFLLLTSLALFVLIQNEEEIGIAVCNTEQCFSTAKKIDSYLDRSIDACENFYQFACGSWIKNNPRPRDKQSFSIRSVLTENVMEQMIAFFETKISYNDSDALKKAINVYSGCTDIDKRNDIGLHELKRLLQNVIGFPIMIKDWNSNSYNWEKKFVYTDLKLGSIQPFFRYRVDHDKETNYSTYSIHIYNTDHSVGKELLDQNRRTPRKEREYQDRIREQLKILDIDVSDSQITRDIDDLIMLKIRLANASLIKSRNNDASDAKKMSFYQMESKFLNQINWFKILSTIFKEANVNLTRDEKVYVEDPYYLTELGNILKNTSVRTLANYIALEVVNKFGVATVEKLRKLAKDDNENETLRKFCYTTTERFFGAALDYIYMKKLLDANVLFQIREFIEHLKYSFKLTLKQNKWMDNEARVKAEFKLNKIFGRILFLSSITDENDLDAYYSELGFLPSQNYLTSYKKLVKWEKIQSLQKLRQDANSFNIISVPTDMFTSLKSKTIEIQIAAFQPPFYHHSSPSSINFGAIGNIVAREIMFGAKIDDGKSNSKINESRKNYAERINCFKTQYSEFKEPNTGLKVNGTLTLQNNIAENVGVQEAFTAFKIHEALRGKIEEMRLPKPMDDFSMEQLFFIAFAQLWCNNDSEEEIKYKIESKPTPPDSIRAIVPVQNYDEFAKAFNCKLGLKMNPQKKCTL
ncbi:hypothetical protein B4U79_12204, partial [Dinothrombium tinctorium]